MNVTEFVEAFISALRADPPNLPDNVLNKATFSDWINRHFTAEDLQVLRRYEDTYGEEFANEVVFNAFEAAGLPRPTVG